MNKKLKLLFGGVIVAVALALFVHYLLSHSIAVLDPKGPVAQKERNIIIFTLALSLLVVIPVYILTFYFAWHYRESNTSAKYSPDLDHGRVIETAWWLIPSALITVFSVVAFKSSHDLDPFKPLSSTTPSMTIQVVALQWKWLFIYPGQDIATVNFIQIPVSTPVNFQITADAPMNSFWIPQLGGQIYAMSGMSTNLSLEASQTGVFHGSSANISGQGFSSMAFNAKATSRADFEAWVKTVRRAPDQLNLDKYNQLAQPSSDHPVTYFSSQTSGLYNQVVSKFEPFGHLHVGAHQ